MEALVKRVNRIVGMILPRLDNDSSLSMSSILNDLEELIRLAVAFKEFNAKAQSNWDSLARTMEERGVELWNASTNFRSIVYEAEEHRIVYARVRHAAYSLLEAGMESQPDSHDLVQMIQLASKAACALSAVHDLDSAQAVLESAAQFEQRLRERKGLDGMQPGTVAAALTTYYCESMTIAAEVGNSSAAWDMLQQCMNETSLALLPTSEIELLSTKILNIGKKMMKDRSEQLGKTGNPGDSDALRALDAIRWLEAALAVLESRIEGASMGLWDLKRVTLRSLARAFMVSSDVEPRNLASAEHAIQLLFVTSAETEGSAEHQQLLWLKLALIKRCNAPDKDLLDTIRLITSTMEISEENVASVCVEMQSLGAEDSGLFIAVIRLLLRRCMDSLDQDVPNKICQALLTLMKHCESKVEDDATYSHIASVLNYIHENTYFALDRASSLACQKILIDLGQRLQQARKWTKAANFFLLCTHDTFNSTSNVSFPKAFRKAALAFYHAGDYERTFELANLCPPREARTQYLYLIAAVRQGREEDAISAVRNLVNTSDCEHVQGPLLHELAKETELSRIAQSVLETLLDVFRVREERPGQGKVLDLYRCIIRLLVDRLDGKDGPPCALLSPLFRHLEGLHQYLAEKLQTITPVTITNDLQWMWRIIYNVGVRGCIDWEDNDVTELFRHSILLMDACEGTIPGKNDNCISIHRAIASFMVTTGKVFEVRNIADRPEVDALRRATLERIRHCKRLLSSARRSVIPGDPAEQMAKMSQACLVYEVEQHSYLGHWEAIVQLIKETARLPSGNLDAFEMIADVLWKDANCPADVLCDVLGTILRTSLEAGNLPESKFCGWLRALCDILLTRGRSSDREKTMHYFNQAIDLLSEWQNRPDLDDIYPPGERQWLLNSAYNAGIQEFQQSGDDGGRAWFSIAERLCRYVPDGEDQRNMIVQVQRSQLQV